MYILMISRGFPSKKHPQWGCFEKDQAEALAKLGHKVIVMSVDARLTTHRGSLGTHHLNINGVEYYNTISIPGKFLYLIFGESMYWNKIKPYAYRRLFKKIVSTHGLPDIIYSHFFFITAVAAKLKEEYRIPLIGVEHFSKFNDNSLSAKESKIAQSAFDRCDQMIAVSKSLAQKIHKYYGRQCEVVHNMFGSEFNIDIDFEKPRSNDPIIFVSTASLIYRKGFDMLIKAFAAANIPKEKWQLRIIGWGKEESNLKKLINDKGLDENIHLLGKMDKNSIVEELKKGHVFVLPSRNENFSVAVLEALSAGLPVIATECGGIRECITKENGIITPVDDVEAMSKALIYVIDNYSQFNRDAIAQDCKNRFSPQSIAQKISDIMEDTIRLAKK